MHHASACPFRAVKVGHEASSEHSEHWARPFSFFIQGKNAGRTLRATPGRLNFNSLLETSSSAAVAYSLKARKCAKNAM